MMADDLHKESKQNIPNVILELKGPEDGENGCEIYYPKDEPKTGYKTYAEMQQAEGSDNPTFINFTLAELCKSSKTVQEKALTI